MFSKAVQGQYFKHVGKYLNSSVLMVNYWKLKDYVDEDIIAIDLSKSNNYKMPQVADYIN